MSSFQKQHEVRMPNLDGLNAIAKDDILKASKRGIDLATLEILANRYRLTPELNSELADTFKVPMGKVPGDRLNWWREKSVVEATGLWPDDFSLSVEDFYQLQIPRTLSGDKRLSIQYVRQLRRCCLTWVLNFCDDVVTDTQSIPGHWTQRLDDVRQVFEFLDMLVVALIKGTDIHWFINSFFSNRYNSDNLMCMRDFLQHGFMLTIDRFPEEIDDNSPRKDYHSVKQHIWFYNGLYELLTAYYHGAQDKELDDLESTPENAAA
ncbi:hypothetical protein IC229_27630 [Spirosoma sp. BT702]|uniref:Uncharacterized protein n=1 Tax=Spirosoma profusum TaxID=2771354 RepID=A0A927ASU9_9BACT|nr:hypothetical protein [Spirosoma profusum]MBD2704443.1 hypothetical protein [Spirosoma profusum]